MAVARRYRRPWKDSTTYCPNSEVHFRHYTEDLLAAEKDLGRIEAVDRVREMYIHCKECGRRVEINPFRHGFKINRHRRPEEV